MWREPMSRRLPCAGCGKNPGTAQVMAAASTCRPHHWPRSAQDLRHSETDKPAPVTAVSSSSEGPIPRSATRASASLTSGGRAPMCGPGREWGAQSQSHQMPYRVSGVDESAARETSTDLGSVTSAVQKDSVNSRPPPHPDAATLPGCFARWGVLGGCCEGM